MNSLHSRLREATRAAHHALDHHPVLVPLVRGGLTHQGYADALQALHSIYFPLENVLCTAAVAKGFDYGGRLKHPALEADLKDLGRVPRATFPKVPPPKNAGALIGMLYTLEGSTLGGQVIQRILSTGPCSRFPMRFFSGYGGNTLAHWQEFLEFAEMVCPVDEIEDACFAAVAVFELIKQQCDEVIK